MTLLSVPPTEEPDKFDKDFNDSESEEDDNDQEETALRKNERAVKVRLCKILRTGTNEYDIRT